MKKIFFMAAIAATTMLASCTNDNTGNENAGNGEETYAGVKITIPMGTRATETGSAEESAINTVGVYIIEQATDVIHEKILAKDTDFEAVGNVITATTAIKTTTGTKDVYVIANPTTTLLAKIASMRKAAFTNTLGTTLGLNETDFYTMETGALVDMVMTGQEIGHDMTTVQSAEDALGDLLPIEIARNTSKVVLKAKETIQVDGGAVSNITFGLASKNQDSYLSSLMSASSAFGTPHNEAPASAIANSADPYFNYFSSIPPATYKPIVAAATTRTAADGFYVLENSTTTSPKMVGNTTAVVVKLTFTPTTVVKTWAAGDVRTTGAGVAEDTFYVYTGGDNTYWSEAAYNAFYASGADQPAKDAIAADFVKYTDGTCYYKIYVVATQDGAKEVLRNNYYEMSLAHVKGPGKPAADTGVEPKTPIEDDTWLGLELTVLPWTVSATEWTVQ